jgi:hypothetical protein
MCSIHSFRPAEKGMNTRMHFQRRVTIPEGRRKQGPKDNQVFDWIIHASTEKNDFYALSAQSKTRHHRIY